MNTNYLSKVIFPLCLTTFLIFAIATAQTVGKQCVPPDEERVCRAGKYNNGNFCAPCPPGTISGPGAYFCKPCPAGTASQYGTACVKCPKGWYVTTVGSCERCPGETYSDQIHSPKCVQCPTNHTTSSPYEGVTSVSECEACGKGEFMRFSDDYNRCQSCDSGQYQDKIHQLHCLACPEGHGLANDDYKDRPSSVADCDPCPPGTYSKFFKVAEVEFRKCTACPEGTYADTGKLGQCKPCPEGSVSVGDRTRCVPNCDLSTQECEEKGCPPGTEPNPLPGNGEPRCTRCPSGKVNSEYSTTPCLTCISKLVASSDQQRCECTGNRVYKMYGDSGACANCPQFATKDKGTCKCPKGQSYDGFNCRCKPLYKRVGMKCVKCTKLEISNSRTRRGFANRNQCNLCNKGRYLSKETGKCTKCQEGFMTYGQTDQTECERCREAHANADGKTVCGCAPGHRFVKDRVCEPCKPGEALKYPTRCGNCGYRFYSDEPGLDKCKLCPKGQRYSTNDKQTRCPPKCPENGYLSNHRCVCRKTYILTGTPTNPVCSPCPDGQVRRGGMESQKCFCKDGYGKRKGKCVICKPGTYGRDGFCRKCPMNSVTVLPGRRFCRQCKPGSYSICFGGTRCLRCRPGRFITAGAKCGRCASGFFVKNGKCEKCVNGVSNGGDVSFCTPCPAGKKPSIDGKRCV